MKLHFLYLSVLVPCLVLAQTAHHVPADYGTIAQAIAAAQAGDTIMIGAGTFAEQLVIEKNLTLIGAGSSKTLIQEAPSIPDSTALHISGATVSIRDMQFNGFMNTDARRRGIVAVNAHLTIRQCVFVLLANVNIASVNGFLDVDSVLITCINSGNNTPVIDSAAPDQGSGILCDNGIMLANARFTINHLTAGAGIDHIIDIYPTSSGNVLHDDYPLDTTQSTQGTIENSTLYGSRISYYGQGIRIFGSFDRPAAQLCIRNNRFVGQAIDSAHANPNMFTTAGISFNGTSGYADIYGNTISRFNTGISLYGYSTASIHDNFICNNARYGIVTSWGGGSYAGLVDLGGGSYGSSGGNRINANGIYNVMNVNSLTVWALHNDWGSTDSLSIQSRLYDFCNNASLGKVNYDVAVLPVELTAFTAAPVNANAVLLRWTTASEVNNYGFIVQSKRPGEKDFADIAGAFVSGHRTTTVAQSYAFTVSGLIEAAMSFRLKQLDLDGAVHYSEPITVNTMGIPEFTPVVLTLSQNYPNPFNPSTEFRFSVAKSGLTTLSLWNLLGQNIASIFDGIVEGGRFYIAKFDGKGLDSGVYFARLQSGTESRVKRVILLK